MKMMTVGKEPVDDDCSVVIASRFLPTYYGGLSQYQRMLGEHLSQDYGLSGMFFAESIRPIEQGLSVEIAGWELVVLDSAGSWKWGRKFCSRCASRPFLHGLLEKAVAVKWRRLNNLLPRSVKCIHFVGTGWDLFGFALLHVARQRGIRFTVCPAVHPSEWGDDVVDIRLYQAADQTFALSDYEKEWLVKKGVAGEKITRTGLPPMCLTTGNGISFRARHALMGRPLVLFLGRKDEGKGYPALVQAWKQVQARFPTACLVAIGPQESSISTVVDQEQDGILNLGVVSEEEKADALAACDVFCLPSAAESFGIVYLEAWFYSKPVICGTAPACRELIKNGETGLWASQETESLTGTICQLLSDPARAIKMGEKGKQEQMATYTWEKIGQKHVQEFFGYR